MKREGNARGGVSKRGEMREGDAKRRDKGGRQRTRECDAREV
jgi:hypothetical protein